jgi:hypothetical protein
MSTTTSMIVMTTIVNTNHLTMNKVKMIVNVNPNAVNLNVNPNAVNPNAVNLSANPSIVNPSTHVIDFIPNFFYVRLNGSSIKKI